MIPVFSGSLCLDDDDGNVVRLVRQADEPPDIPQNLLSELLGEWELKRLEYINESERRTRQKGTGGRPEDSGKEGALPPPPKNAALDEVYG